MNQDQFYAIRQARAWLKEKPTYLDTETTGFSFHDEVIDLALVNSDGTALIDTLIRPTVPIGAGAEAIHGIHNEDIIDAPGFNEIMINLVKLTEDRLVLIYNAAFDQRLLRQSLAACKLRKPTVMSKVNCVMLLYAQFFGEWNNYRQSYTWQSQAKAAKHLNIKLPADLHRAAADARLCRAIVEAMAATPLPGEE